MEISTKLNGKSLTITVSGRLDSVTAPTLEPVVAETNDADEMIFDFANLEYISSAGLRVMLMASKKISNVVVINANEMVKEVFTITGLDTIVKIK